MADQGVNVGDLIAQLKLDLSSFQQAVATLDQNLRKIKQGFEGAEVRAGKFQDSLTAAGEAARKMGLESGLLGQALSFLTNPLTLAGAAFGGLVLAMEHARQSAVDTAIEVRQLMAVSGLSATQADQLGDAFKALGFNSDQLAVMMFRMGSEIESGGAGLGRLGVSLRAAGGEAKTEGELFLEVRDKLSQLGSAAERNAALIDIFQRSARMVAPVFDLNRDAFVKFLEKAELLHPWSEQQQADSIALLQSQQQLKLAWEGLWSTIGTGLAGPGAEWNDWLAGVVVRLREATKTVIDFMKAGPFGSLDSTIGAAAGMGTADVLRSGPSGPAAAPPATATRQTTAEFSALRAQLTERYQAVVEYYRQLDSLRQLDAARNHTTEVEALQAQLATYHERVTATGKYYADLRELARRETGGPAVDNPAGNIAFAQLATQEQAALSQLEQAQIGIQTRLAGAFNQQNQVFDAFLRRAIVATPVFGTLDIMEEANKRIAEFEQTADRAAKAAPLFASAIGAVVTSVRDAITEHAKFSQELKGLTEQIALTEKGAADYEKLVKSLTATFEAADVQAEAFARSQAVIQQMAGIERGAGVSGVNLSGQLQTGVTSQIRVLLGQQAEWNQELANVEAGSQRFDELTAAIERSALQVAALRTQLGELQQITELKGWVTDIFGGLERAISTSVTGVIQGTTTMAQAFAKLGQSIVISIEEVLIKRAFKGLEDAFFRMLDDMDNRAAISTALRFFGSLFNTAPAGAPDTAPLTSGVGSEVLVGAVMQHGGVVRQPTLALIGEGGPEAVVPLEHLAMGGGGVQITVINNASAEVTAQDKGTGANGQRQIEILIEGTVQQGLAGGRYDRTLQTMFGLTRTGAGR